MRSPPSGLITHTDGHDRCWWCGSDPLYTRYHDEEWGRPVTDDHRLFEKIILEGFQSGLSWITILRKREHFRQAFHHFDPARIARCTQRDVARLLKNEGIIRHRGKIEAAINNAQRALELIDDAGSLARYFWSFKPPAASRPKRLTREALCAMTTSAESIAMSKDLKKRGWSFVGPTTMYAFMQAMGLVNDHLEGCEFRADIDADHRRLTPPSGLEAPAEKRIHRPHAAGVARQRHAPVRRGR